MLLLLFLVALPALSDASLVLYELRNLVTGDYLLGENSRWELLKEEERYDEFEVVRIKNFNTTLCLDTNYEAKIYTLACNGGGFQRWILHPLKQNRVKLENLATSFYLGSTGESIVAGIPFNNLVIPRRTEWYMTQVSLCN